MRAIGLVRLTAACALLVPASTATAAWTPAETVARGRVAELDLAANDRDEAILAWRDVRAGVVRARFRHGAGRLGRVRTLSHRAREGESPSVAIDARGDALVTWVESRDGRRRTIWASVGRRGGRWLPAEPLGRSAKSAPQPRAAIAASREAVVVWRNDTRLKAAFRRWNRGFSAARFVGPSGAHHVVRYDRGSRAWLVYAPYPRAGALRLTSSRPGARRFERPGTIGNRPASFPALAASSTGELAVAYRRSPVPGTEDETGPIEVTVRRPSGSWSAPQAVSPPAYAVPGQPPVTAADRPDIAAGSDGTMVVTWLQLASTGPNPAAGEEQIAAAVRDPGAAAFGPAVHVGMGAEFTYPSVAIDDARRIAILWRGTADARIVASVREPGGPFGAPEALSGSRAFFWPRVAAGRTPIAGWQEPGRIVVRAWR